MSVSLQQQPAPAPKAPSAPRVPQSVEAVGSPSLESLRALEVTFQKNVAVFQAQHDVLERALQTNDPGVRMTAGPQLIQVDLQLATAKAELASVQSQLDAHQGGRTARPAQPGQTIAPPASRAFIDRIDPDAVTAVFVISCMALILPLSIGLIRRMFRRAPQRPASPSPDVIGPRLERLEHAVDTIAIEIERVLEGQRFVTKVMAERPPAARPAAQPEDGGVAAVEEGKPLLALGAGPAEPIRVAERQTVRQAKNSH